MSRRPAWQTLDGGQHPGVAVKTVVRNGRVTITGLRIERPEGVSTIDLRALSLPAIEAMLNAGPKDRGNGSHAPRRGISYHETVADSLHLVDQAGDALARPPVPTSADLRIEGATAGPARRPDAFYAAVADRYRACVANSVRPAPALAKANSVPVTTVHRWVKEARARGLLAPSRKAGATG